MAFAGWRSSGSQTILPTFLSYAARPQTVSRCAPGRQKAGLRHAHPDKMSGLRVAPVLRLRRTFDLRCARRSSRMQAGTEKRLSFSRTEKLHLGKYIGMRLSGASCLSDRTFSFPPLHQESSNDILLRVIWQTI